MSALGYISAWDSLLCGKCTHSLCLSPEYTHTEHLYTYIRRCTQTCMRVCKHMNTQRHTYINICVHTCRYTKHRHRDRRLIWPVSLFVCITELQIEI